MNIDLFKQVRPSLEKVIRDWFKERPDILTSPDDEVVISIDTQKRELALLVKVNFDIVGAQISLDEVLDRHVRVLEPYLGNRLVRVMNAFNNNDVIALRQVVSKQEFEVRKWRNFGKSSMDALKGALKEIDPRLHLGMELE